MNAVLASLVLLTQAAGADDLASTTLNGLKLKVPAAWKHSVEEGSHKYESPDGKGSFSLSIFPVTPPRDPKLCVDQLLEALGGKDWERVSVGLSPGARKVDLDSSEQGEAETRTIVGCNGSTKWALTWSSLTSKKSRFDAVLSKVLDSIRYAK
jgi:hypothetical protein